MKVQRWIAAIVMAVLAIGWLGASAQAEQSADQQVQAELKALKAEIAELKAQQNESWLNERRAEEVKTLVRDVLSDAETRSSLMDSAVTAGHNGENFFISSEDGAFLFVPSGYVQTRYVANFRDDTTDDPSLTNAPVGAGIIGSDDDGTDGFSLRRAKFQGHGHIFGPQLRYYFSLAQGDDGRDGRRSTIFEDYYVEYDLGDDIGMPGLSIRGGRFRQPFLRENIIDASQQMAVERSLVNEVYNVDRSEAIMLAYKQDMWRAMLSFSNGTDGDGSEFDNDGGGLGSSGVFVANDENGNATVDAGETVGFVPLGGFVGAAGAGAGVDFALTARVDVKLMGEWDQWDDFQAWDGEPMAVFFGAALHYEELQTGFGSEPLVPGGVAFDPAGNGFATGDDLIIGDAYDGINNSVLSWTVDASVEYQRLGAYVAGYGQHLIESDDLDTSAGFQAFGVPATIDAPNWNNYGLQIMAGYQVIPNELEPFIRYERIMLDEDLVVLEDTEDLNIITFGVNWYGHKHDSKLTVDVTVALDPVNEGFLLGSVASGLDSLGLQQDAYGEDGQVALRAQYQLRF